LKRLFLCGGLFLINRAGTVLGVDGHLLLRHSVQGKAGCHFRNPGCALGDNHFLNRNDRDENNDAYHKADCTAGTYHKGGKGLDHAPVKTRPLRKNEPGRRYVQRQTENGYYQKYRRKEHKIRRFLVVKNNQKHQKRNYEVYGHKSVQYYRWEGNDKHRKHHHHYQSY